MFSKPKTKSRAQLEIDRLLAALANETPGSKEYGAILDQVKDLHKIESENTPEPVSANTKANIAANIAGILLIINHEHLGVISTKAIGFVKQVR